jgi:hypothetical protein
MWCRIVYRKTVDPQDESLNKSLSNPESTNYLSRYQGNTRQFFMLLLATVVNVLILDIQFLRNKAKPGHSISSGED